MKINYDCFRKIYLKKYPYYFLSKLQKENKIV